MQNAYSVFHLIAGALEHCGYRTFPDVQEIAEYSVTTLGGPAFGIPRVAADADKPDSTPLEYIKRLWPILHQEVVTYCENPADRPVAYAIAIQQAIVQNKQVLAPDVAAKIALESAFTTSKMHLPQLGDIGATA